MKSTGSDLLGILAAAYAPAASDEAWLARILDAAGPVLDQGLGVTAFFYDWSEPTTRRIWGPLARGVPDGALLALDAINRLAPEELTRLLVRPEPACATLSARLGLGARFADMPLARDVLEPLGVRDFLAVTGTNPSGHGCVIGAPLARVQSVPRDEALAWNRVAAHIAAGLRVRRRAAPDPSDAPGPAPSSAIGDDAQTASDAWRGLVDGRWSLADHFDHRGTRYLVARRNARAPSRATSFTKREEQILELAATGRANKLIASALGLSVSTVGKHVGDVSARLGITGRVALIHAYRAHVSSRSVTTGGEGLAREEPTGLRVAFGEQGIVLFGFDIPPDDGAARLSDAERAVALLVLDGHANGEIAAMRGTAARTVANQVASLLHKLGIGSRAELATRFLLVN